MNSNKPIIAHYNENFYLKIQPFIYNYISNLERFYPIYFAKQFLNLDLYPLPENDLYRVPVPDPKRYTLQWLYCAVLRRVFGIKISATENILRKRRVKLIHAHFGPEGFEALALRGNLKIPLVVSFYGFDVSLLAEQPEWLERYQILFQEGQLFLVEGKFMKSRLINLGAAEDKVKIQRIAIPVESFPFFLRKPKMNGAKVIFFFCGRFREKKGLIYTLQAFEQVRQSRKDFEFRIVGGEKLTPEIEEFVRRHQMAEYVKLLGALDHKDYLREMSKADIYIHPSVTAQDGNSEGGAPTTILEAQAMGIPILSTYHADIPNVVVPGQSALLAKERDWESLASNVHHLMENQNEWAKMGQAGRNFVEEYHNVKKEVQGLEESYSSLINA